MLKCNLCGRPLEPTAAWKGRGERYYCGEFCAEAEDIESPPLVRNAAADAPAFARAATARKVAGFRGGVIASLNRPSPRPTQRPTGGAIRGPAAGDGCRHA
jgi:hypothetical protein